jgi:hypothetical protein|tara:strand:- start:5145 stop:5312 length:168 start_codon:yes stop_codon:yes gene_type:complete
MDKDTAESIVVNGAAIGLSFSGAEQWLRMTALLLGILFTLYKFYRLYKDDKSSNI